MPYAKECSAREFLSLSKRKGAFERETRFTPDTAACDRAKNPLLSRRHAFLMAFADDRPAARLLLVDGGDTAWFSMPVMKDDACAAALVEKAVETARAWGAGEIKGPVSPDGSGFGLGAPMPGSFAHSAPWHPERDDDLTSALVHNGFRASTHLLELSLPILDRTNPYRGAEEWALARQGIQIEALPFGRRACEAAFAASEDAHARGYAAFERVFVRCGELAPDLQAVIAFRDERPVGWLLYVPVRGTPYTPPKTNRPGIAEIWKQIGSQQKGRETAVAVPAGYAAAERASNGRAVRLLHMQILPAHRRSSCAAALLDRAWRMAQQFGAERIFASTIDESNPASLSMARNSGATTLADYALFSKKIDAERIK